MGNVPRYIPVFIGSLWAPLLLTFIHSKLNWFPLS